MSAPSKASSKGLTPPGTLPVHPRHFTISHRLLTLPVELIHQIFDYLSLSHILEILCLVSSDTATITYLDECFLTHFRWFQVLFPSNQPRRAAYEQGNLVGPLEAISYVNRRPGIRRDAPPPPPNQRRLAAPQIRRLAASGVANLVGPLTAISHVNRMPGIRRDTDPLWVLGGNQAMSPIPSYQYPPGGGPAVWSIKRGTVSRLAGEMGLDKEEAAHQARVGYFQELKKYFGMYLGIAHLAYRNRLNEIINELGLGGLGQCMAESISGELILVSIKKTIIYRRLAESQFHFFLPAYREFTLKNLASRGGDEDQGQVQKKKIIIEYEELGNQEEFPLPADGGDWDFINLHEQWTALRSAERRLMLTKASQLRRLASLIQRYPGMLRFGKNPSQNKPTGGREVHTIQRLLRDAERLEMDGRTEMWHSMVAGYVFKRQAFPLVPFDRILWGVVKVLERFPLDTAANYPDEIAVKLRMVTEKMEYYTIHPPIQMAIGKQAMQEPPQRLIRTLYTPFSVSHQRDGGGLMQPRFVGCEVEARERLMRDSGVSTKYVRHMLPLREEEFDWLEAFMECVEWFGKWETRLWKEDDGVSVGEWWRKRVSE